MVEREAVSAAFDGLQPAADTGWDGCTLPVTPKCQGGYVDETAGGDQNIVGAYGGGSKISGSNGIALLQLAGDNWLVLVMSRRFFLHPRERHVAYVQR